MTRRSAACVALVVLLLAVVAFASRGIPAAGVVRASAPSAIHPIPGAVFAFSFFLFMGVALGATILLTVALVGAVRPHRKDPDDLFSQTYRPPWWSGTIAMLLIVVAIAVPVALALWNRQTHARAVVVQRVGAGPEPARVSGPAPGAPGLEDGDLILVAIAAGAAIAASFLIVIARGHGAMQPPPGRRESRSMGRVVEATIEDIRRDPDPRRAIIAAYARMERTLTLLGWPRRPSSTPVEYLEESLERLAVPGPPARALTELFEIAMFSDHRVDDTMKQRAIQALVAVRRALVRGEPV